MSSGGEGLKTAFLKEEGKGVEKNCTEGSIACSRQESVKVHHSGYSDEQVLLWL